MFGRAFNIDVKLVKKDPTNPNKTSPRIELDADEISRTVKSVVRYVSIAGVTVMGAACVFNTFHDSVVIAANNKTQRFPD